jgi:decaprenylphospho-beta-D-ribofuranose 2-oxidase
VSSLVKRETISGWGNYPSLSARVRQARHRGDLSLFARERPPAIATGSRRSYGDACLFSNVISTLDLSHILGFDSDKGIMRAEAGVTIDDLIRFALPLGWFPPVTPGTKFPTLGGCVAADVHGKNHHVDGSLGDHVDVLELILADGTQIHCSPTHHAELFQATLGGMGLTGFIYAVTLRLRRVPSAFIAVRSERAGNLRAALQLLSETEGIYTYSVAWIDCLARGGARGRSILMLGNHAEPNQLPAGAKVWQPHSHRRLDFPVDLPEFVLNPLSMRLFNSAYYHRHIRRRRETIRHYDPYFYPLDVVGRWNRVYGRPGFLQYQFVVPFAGGADVLDEILERISRRGTGSFLAVLKSFGKGRGFLSFPEPGYTLALDFPLTDRTIIAFLREITTLVRDAGGRVYLAKDAILKRDDFDVMYPDLSHFKRVKQRYDPENHFRSAQSERLGIR